MLNQNGLPSLYRELHSLLHVCCYWQALALTRDDGVGGKSACTGPMAAGVRTTALSASEPSSFTSRRRQPGQPERGAFVHKFASLSLTQKERDAAFTAAGLASALEEVGRLGEYPTLHEHVVLRSEEVPAIPLLLRA